MLYAHKVAEYIQIQMNAGQSQILAAGKLDEISIRVRLLVKVLLHTNNNRQIKQNRRTITKNACQ